MANLTIGGFESEEKFLTGKECHHLLRVYDKSRPSNA